MYRNVVRYVMHCRECQRRKSVPQRPPGRLVPIPPAIAPFHRIGIDLLGRFPNGNDTRYNATILSNDFDDNNITKIAARAEESRQLARVHTLRAQDKDRRRYDSNTKWYLTLPEISYGFILQKLREVVHVLRMKPYHDPAEQIETEDIPPKNHTKDPSLVPE
ncbi:transposon Tf2-6 polyprotein [Trichonephila clavipes]|nr:transposon Tf2-6 polyprotein [Trichonephila clavipes]